MIEITGIDQKELWDSQHYRRGGEGSEGSWLRDVPNDAAVTLNGLLRPSSVIFEVGSANGRDARYLASQGHSVIASDFSRVALTQLEAIAREQGVINSIQIVEFDVNTINLPIRPPRAIDAFYARSALHISDERMLLLGQEIDRVAKPGAVVLIEGKTSDDPKIKRSIDLNNGLAVDYDGHLRRIWTLEFMEQLADKSKWDIKQLSSHTEEFEKKQSEFLRLVATIPDNRVSILELLR